MKIYSILLALVALGTGVTAAWYWYLSAKVDPRTGWDYPPGNATKDSKVLLDNLNALVVWIFAIKDALEETSRLNRNAAIWTAISVLLSALAALAGSLNSN